MEFVTDLSKMYQVLIYSRTKYGHKFSLIKDYLTCIKNINIMNLGPKIMVIEDDSALREEIGFTLDMEGYNIIEAESGEEGIDILMSEKPELVLCDLKMKGIDGFETIKRIRRLEENFITPVIIISGKAERSDVRKGMQFGVNDYLTKPFSNEDLLASVKAQLKTREKIKNKVRNEGNYIRKALVLNLPHEFRTPLNSVIGFGSLLSMPESHLVKTDLIEIGQTLVSSGHRLLEIVEEYLMFANLLSSENQLNNGKRTNVDRSIVSVIAEETSSKYMRSDDMIVNVEDAVLKIGNVHFEVLVKNLLDNSFKFSNTGDKVQVISTIDNGMYKLSFSDEGIGFPVDKIESIGAFQQFDRDKNEQQGLGMGLAISKLIVEKYSGALFITREAKGTTVTVLLPVDCSINNESGKSNLDFAIN